MSVEAESNTQPSCIYMHQRSVPLQRVHKSDIIVFQTMEGSQVHFCFVSVLLTTKFECYKRENLVKKKLFVDGMTLLTPNTISML